MDEIPVDVGSRLAALRTSANVAQAVVASKFKIDQSRISRIEKGDVTPSVDEVRSYLEALNTDAAREYLAYLAQEWRSLPRPAFENPDRMAIWKGEQALHTLEVFERSRELPAPVQAEIDMHKKSVQDAARFLSRTDHRVAFIGEIGVGKTTALCLASDLVLHKPGLALDNKVLLETGAGRTTLCEVRVRNGESDGWAMVIEPQPEAEIYRLVADFCEGLREAPAEGDGEPMERGLPRELDRAIRNMTDLPRTSTKLPDGKRERRDPARELAKKFPNQDELRAEVASRLQLWKRTTRELSQGAAADSMAWVRKTFQEINNGKNATVSLPQRIDILTPRGAAGVPLLRQSKYQIEVIDTRGVDGTAIRGDLKNCVDEHRTLTILCSKFASAPDAAMQTFITHTRETGATRALDERMALLILPRGDEAFKLKEDGADEMVDTAEEGCDLKRDAVDGSLRHIGVEGLPILFFNAGSDPAEGLAEEIMGLVGRLRAAHTKRIHGLRETVDHLIENYAQEAAAAVRREVIRRITVWSGQSQDLGRSRQPAHALLVSTLMGSHARTVWATTTRRGGWYNLDICYHLGAGAVTEAKRRATKPLSGLAAVLENVLGDTELENAHGFVREVQLNLTDWSEAFFEAVRRAGEETFRPALQDDDNLWADLSARWGQGAGYRADIAEKFKVWFLATEREHLHQRMDVLVQDAWQENVINQLDTLCA